MSAGLCALDFYDETSWRLAGVTLDRMDDTVDAMEVARTMCRTFGFDEDDLPTREDLDESNESDDEIDDAFTDESDDDDDDTVLAPFDTENPWLQKVFSLPAYGRVSAQAVELLREISPDLSERIVATLPTRHGRWRRGYLIATTRCLRYIQVLPTRNDDFWDYSYKLEVRGGIGLGGVIETVDGHLFQTRYGKARKFRDLYAAMQHATAWEVENAPQPVVVQQAQVADGLSLSTEIERLGALLAQGLLTEQEFQAAKRRVIGE